MAHPGVGVKLARVGAGNTLSPHYLLNNGFSFSPFSRRYQLDCLTSAVVDATQRVIGDEAAAAVASFAGGPLMHSSLRSLGGLLHGAAVRCRVEKLPASARAAIEKSDYLEAFKWFVHSGGGGVYVVQLQAANRGDHAVAVDTGAGLVIDKEQPVVLGLSVGTLVSTAGLGDGNPRVVAGRKIVIM